MLKSLYVKNFALISELRVIFDSGLNVITGETGAGKSIIIGALGAILGEKLNKDIIRGNAETCVLEAEFVVGQTPEFETLFTENELEWESGELIIRRELKSNSRNRCFINDSPVSISILSELGDLLVDLHGQHQHQLLLQPRTHIDYLDEFAQLKDSVQNVRIAFNAFKKVQKELEDLLAKQHQIVQSRDLYTFQLKEIEGIDPQPDEDTELEAEEKILKNAEVLYQKCSTLLKDLYDKNGSVTETLINSENSLNELARIDSSFDSLKEECTNAKLVLEELTNSIRNYAENIAFNPDRLEKIRYRLASLSGLKKKYRGTIDAILIYKEKAAQELDLIENLDNEIVQLEEKIATARTQLAETCFSLSTERKTGGEKLSETVSRELALLGMPAVLFGISQKHNETTGANFIENNNTKLEVSAKGIDKIEFLISTNPGEDLKPLASIASGGEISRIMLALKKLLASADKVPVLVFDEIDIGISGRIAQAVGKSLRLLAKTHQVICITHLPQIASLAQHHYLVEKSINGAITQTEIRKLSPEERTRQVAQLFGGEKVTEAHLKSASELIQESENLAN